MADDSDGYTLIEVLIVSIVIGLLAVIAVPIILHHRERAWQGAVDSDLRNAAIEFESAAKVNGGQYPVALPASVAMSPDVALTVGAAASPSRICLKGNHYGLATTTYYDSAAGGLTSTVC